jgi:hypothetical protein
MKLLKEIGFRCFILLVMLSLAFVAYDMSRPIMLNNEAILTQDVINYFAQPFAELFNLETKANNNLPGKDYNFALNCLLPLIVYFTSIGGFTYLLIEDFKLLKIFSRQNRLARYIWILWIIILVGLTLIPVFFSLQLLMKGVILAVIATAIFLILISIIYRLSYKADK